MRRSRIIFCIVAAEYLALRAQKYDGRGTEYLAVATHDKLKLSTRICFESGTEHIVVVSRNTSRRQRRIHEEARSNTLWQQRRKPPSAEEYVARPQTDLCVEFLKASQAIRLKHQPAGELPETAGELIFWTTPKQHCYFGWSAGELPSQPGSKQAS